MILEVKKDVSFEYKGSSCCDWRQGDFEGINLTINTGETHALMGPNGNGKSTLLGTIMGHPKYKVTQGTITLDGEDVLSMSVDERSRKGLF